MSLLLLFGGGTAAPVVVDPETTPHRVFYDLDNRAWPQVDMQATYALDNREEYPT